MDSCRLEPWAEMSKEGNKQTDPRDIEAPITFLEEEAKPEIDGQSLVTHGEHDGQQNDSNNEKTSFADAFEITFLYIAADEVIVLLEMFLETSLYLFFIRVWRGAVVE